MNRTRNVVIVGGGVAGILATKCELDKGNKVTLIEASSKLGGLLKSDKESDYYFDYGTHIVPETGNKDLDNLLFSDFKEADFNINRRINAGNYFNGIMNNNSCYIDTTTLPIDLYKKGCYDLISFKETPAAINNLDDWFVNQFGETFAKNIFCNVAKKYFGEDASNLAPSVGYFFDMSRLLAFDQTTTDGLSVIPRFYSVLGHHSRKDGVKKYYPKRGGVGNLVDNLIENLNIKKASVLLNTKIEKIIESNGTVATLHTNNGLVEVDELIWTIPATLISNYINLGLNIEKPKFRSTLLFDFVFDKPLLTESTFINVYDLNKQSGRITIYQNLTDARYAIGSCTVEVLSDNDAIDEETIIDELHDMGLASANFTCIFSRKRNVSYGFPILTNDYVKKSKIISSAYQDYFKNVLFVGKGAEKSFFMTDVLKEVYTELK